MNKPPNRVCDNVDIVAFANATEMVLAALRQHERVTDAALLESTIRTSSLAFSLLTGSGGQSSASLASFAERAGLVAVIEHLRTLAEGMHTMLCTFTGQETHAVNTPLHPGTRTSRFPGCCLQGVHLCHYRQHPCLRRCPAARR
jgi:hypothetical protein